MDEEARFRRAVEFVLAHEGGLSEDPDDPGGTTRWGISLRYLRSLGQRVGDVDQDGDVDPDDVRRLPREQAIRIYREQWWDRYGYGRLPDPVAAKVLDLSVNMGPTTAHKLLQRALRACGQPVVVDGVLGPKTVEAAQKADEERLMAELRAEAAIYYAALVLAEPSRRKWLRGWLRRACA